MRTRALLALDATTSLCSVACLSASTIVERIEDAGQRHSELILAMVGDVLAEGGLTLADLDEIAFGAGPGSFTGLRIACGVAQGLAFGRELPVRAVSSLVAVAEASGAEAALVALDARMHEVYWAACRRDTGQSSWRIVEGPHASPPNAVDVPAGAGWIAAGDGFAAYPALAERVARAMPVDATLRPSARAVAQLAGRGVGRLTDAASAAPEYVRDKVALTTAERARVA
jgi:tRNA threonylcarbamoyladenosine biosynthesis protein TsaB